MKELFLDAEIEIIRFEAIDVITTSPGDGLDDDELPPDFI
jgi:hypothetical protein